MGYQTSGVKAVPLAKKEGEAYIAATAENALKGKYPLSRFLYIYVNKEPNKPLDKLTYEFVRMVLSKEGQHIVEKDGYVPLSAEMAEKIMKSIQ